MFCGQKKRRLKNRTTYTGGPMISCNLYGKGPRAPQARHPPTAGEAHMGRARLLV